MEAHTQGLVLDGGELAGEHGGGGGLHQVAVGLGGRGRRLRQGHGGLQLERDPRRRQVVGGSRDVVDQPLVLLLRETLAHAVALGGGGGERCPFSEEKAST